MFPLNIEIRRAMCLAGTKNTQLMALRMCPCDHRDVLLSSVYWCHGDADRAGRTLLEKDLSWLMASESSVHGLLTLCLWVEDHAV